METQAVVGNHYQPTNLSFASRLWCVFELAAFLHSQRGKTADLTVCPVSVGSVLLVGQIGLAVFYLLFRFLTASAEFYPDGALVMAALCFPSFTTLAYVALAHCRSIDKIHHQVQNFSIEHSSSGCCALQHIDPRTGYPILCDRAIISRCILAWFGSLQSFEDSVRGQVREVLVYQLMYNTFTYWRMVQLTSPVLFFGLDRLASRVVPDGTFPVGDGRFLIDEVLVCAKDWLVFLPTLSLILLQLAYKLRRSCGTRLKQLLVSLLLVLVGVIIFAAVTAFEATCLFLIEDIVLARLAILAMHLPLALFVWWRVPRAERALA